MIIWDKKKDEWLRIHRNISFKVIADIIENAGYSDFFENPAREEQNIFIVEYHNYTYVVPFIVDGDDNIILKTVFPSRKYDKRYRRDQ